MTQIPDVAHPPPADAEAAPEPDRVDAGSARAPRGRPAILTVLVVLALVAALASAAWYGTRWASDALAGDSTAQVRDRALADARQAAINLTTVNSADVAGTLANWDSVVTGDLATQFAASRSQLEQQITTNPGNTQVSLVNAALSALDVNAGTATALIFADVTSSRSSGQPLAQRFALTMAVQRTDAGWKAAGLQSLAQNAPAR